MVNRSTAAAIPLNPRKITEKMGKFALIAVAVLVVVILGGASLLMVLDIPAPSARVERVIPDARLPK